MAIIEVHSYSYLLSYQGGKLQFDQVDQNRFRVMQALSKLEHAHIQFVRRTNHRRYFLVDLRVFFENARFAGLVQTAHLLFIQI